jgi:hypothetical protein
MKHEQGYQGSRGLYVVISFMLVILVLSMISATTSLWFSAPYAKTASARTEAGVLGPLIPGCIGQKPCDHFRVLMDMIVHGRSMSFSQDSQQRTTMVS